MILKEYIQMEIKGILKNFPKIKLTKKNNINCIDDDSYYYLFIPKGIKYFLWFNNNENGNNCILLELKQDKIIKSYITNVSCDKKLFTNTVLYGSKIKNMFITEDIVYYKNKYIYDYSFNKKLKYLCDFFNNINNNIQNNNSSIFMNNILNIKLCHIENNYKNIDKYMKNIDYELYEIIQIKHIHAKSYKYYHDLSCFKITSTNNDDIYYLYYYDNEKDKFLFHSNACVNTYETSKLLNNIFNKYKKENINIDEIELSDDESEDEDYNINNITAKNEEKDVFVMCQFLPNFKKWMPISKTFFNKNKFKSFNKIKYIENKLLGNNKY